MPAPRRLQASRLKQLHEDKRALFFFFQYLSLCIVIILYLLRVKSSYKISSLECDIKSEISVVTLNPPHPVSLTVHLLALD